MGAARPFPTPCPLQVPGVAVPELFPLEQTKHLTSTLFSKHL